MSIAVWSKASILVATPLLLLAEGAMGNIREVPRLVSLLMATTSSQPTMTMVRWTTAVETGPPDIIHSLALGNRKSSDPPGTLDLGPAMG